VINLFLVIKEIQMKKYIAAIDQGTTSTRFIIFNHAGEVVAVDQKNIAKFIPNPAGWSTIRSKFGSRRTM